MFSEKPIFIKPILEGTKIHTVREDGTNRWKRGNKIHAATGVRTPNYNCFKEMQCVSVQRVFMTYAYNDLIQVSIGGRELHTDQERLEFAQNDGFAEWKDFYNWFFPLIQKHPNKCFSGKVIHWTKKRY